MTTTIDSGYFVASPKANVIADEIPQPIEDGLSICSSNIGRGQLRYANTSFTDQLISHLVILSMATGYSEVKLYEFYRYIISVPCDKYHVKLSVELVNKFKRKFKPADKKLLRYFRRSMGIL